MSEKPDEREPRVSPTDPAASAPADPFEKALARLRPKRDRLDHDVVMYRAGWRAGRAAARRRAAVAGWMRTGVGSAVSALAAGLLVGFVFQANSTVARHEETATTQAPLAANEEPVSPTRVAVSEGKRAESDRSNAESRRQREERWLAQMRRRGVDLDAPPRGLTVQGPIHQPRPLSVFEMMRELTGSSRG